LIIITLQPLGLAFFNSMTKLLTIFYFESFFTSFYLLFFFCILYNSKWFKICRAYRQLALKNESNEAPQFWTFFHTNVSLWSAIAQFFARPKKRFWSIQKLISCNPCGRNFSIFFHMFSSQHNTRSYSYMCLKIFLFQNLVLVLIIAILECFCENIVKELKGLKMHMHLATKLLATPFQKDDLFTQNWLSKYSLSFHIF